MPQQMHVVRDMEIDEVSLVDIPANQHAAVVIAKRANQEEAVADEYFDADGEPVDIDELDAGDVVQDAEGNLFEVESDEDFEGAQADEGELAMVGKSAFFEPAPQRGPVSKSEIDSVREELAKAVSEEDRSEVLSKAFESFAKRAQEAEARTARLESIAKSERDLRLQREYIAKAAEYNVPIAADELGPVLMRAAEALSYDDCAVIHKALSSAGEMLFTEVGYQGQSDNDDPMAQLDAFLDGEIAKSDQPLSKAGAMTAFFDDNPGAYDAYRAERNR